MVLKSGLDDVVEGLTREKKVRAEKKVGVGGWIQVRDVPSVY